MKIGIDFGSCYSFVSVINDKELIDNFIDTEDSNGIPTLYMERDGKEFYGSACQTAFDSESGDVVSDMKRKIRADVNNRKKKVNVGDGKLKRYDEVISNYIRYLIDLVKETAEDKTKSSFLDNNTIESVTITAPVARGGNSSEYNEFLKNTIMEITGLPTNKVHVREEPVAAAISYLRNNQIGDNTENEETILVFDLGGSTLDAAVVNCDYGNDTYRVIETGSCELGGSDWDEALCNLILEKINLKREDIALEWPKFKRNVENTKIRLSDTESTVFLFSDHRVVITRKEFEDCSFDLLDKSMNMIRNVYESAKEDIDKVVLVGGGCNMPQIVKGIEDVMSDVVDASSVELFDPSHAIANGAAIYNTLIMDIGGVSRRRSIQDISSHTYGINIFPTQDSDKYSIYNMIFKGDEFDSYGRIRAISDFVVSAADDSYRKIKFEIYESDLLRRDCDHDGIAETGQNERSKGILITVPIPEQYFGKASMYELRIEMVLTSDHIIEVFVRNSAGEEVDHKKKMIN